MMFRLLFLLPLALIALACVSRRTEPNVLAAPSVVQLVKDARGFRLELNGEPYFIKGVGGTGSRALLLRLGANSIRTWGADDLGAVLDQAQKDGLTVTAGIWLGHADVFDYHDPERVAKQKEMCREVIERYKDHPALLLWAFGNEMEAYGEADDAAVWRAVNDLAAMSKKIDPNHPTMTVIAEIGGQRVPSLERHCPAIDVVGINSYGGAPSLVERYRKQGGTKPFVLTEFGPPGSWESEKTGWAAPLELTSTEKATHYRRSYEAAISGAEGLTLGSYAFLWGAKQEATATWFGMLLKDGSRVEASDVMSEFWTGKPPANRCPRIAKLSVSKTHPLKPGETIEASLQSSDPEGDGLTVRWVLSGEVAKYLTAGQDEAVPDDYPNAVLRSEPASASVKMPAFGGKFRLFAYVADAHGGAAVANVPLFVEGPEPKSFAPTLRNGSSWTTSATNEALRALPATLPHSWREGETTEGAGGLCGFCGYNPPVVYAIDDNGLRIEAVRGMRAKCPCCRETVLAHCGELKVWHWAHIEAAHCDPWWEPETEWHLSWKRYVPAERAEVAMGEHRADLVAPDGAVVELQNSPISIQEIRERERFYGPKMIWLLNGEPFRGNFRVQKDPETARFHWAWPRLTWFYAKRPVFIHGYAVGTLLQGPNTVTGKIEPRFQHLYDSQDVFQIRTTKRRPFAQGEGRIIPLDRFVERMLV